MFSLNNGMGLPGSKSISNMKTPLIKANLLNMNNNPNMKNVWNALIKCNNFVTVLWLLVFYIFNIYVYIYLCIYFNINIFIYFINDTNSV